LLLEYAGEFEGDIKLTREQKNAIQNGLDLEPANTFGASKSKRWKNGVFPYVLASSLSMLSLLFYSLWIFNCEIVFTYCLINEQNLRKNKVMIFLNGQFIIVYTCEPHINHKYSLV
jgi:hypothetical protein